MAKKKANIKLNGTIPVRLYESLANSAQRRGWDVNDEIRWVLETFDRLHLEQVLPAAAHRAFGIGEGSTNDFAGTPDCDSSNGGIQNGDSLAVRPIDEDVIAVLQDGLEPRAFATLASHCQSRNVDAIFSTISAALLFSDGFG